MKKLTKKVIDLELQATNQFRRAFIRTNRNLTQNQQLLINKLDEILGFQQGPASAATLSLKRAEFITLTNQLFAELSEKQVKELTSTLTTVYNNTRVGISLELETPFDITNDFQLKELLNRQSNGLTLSQRIHVNNRRVAERINNDIGRLLYQNASPTQLKAQLAADLNISRASAERLFRTETSKFYSNAAKDSYKAAGIEQMEFLAESDACEVCSSKSGNLYPIDITSPVPVHPNCRCVILPVLPE